MTTRTSQWHRYFCTLTCAALMPVPLWAATYDVADGVLLGEVTRIEVQQQSSLAQLARDHDFGVSELRRANPDLEGGVQEGDEVIMPGSRLLPNGFSPGRLLVELTERRLYYWPAQGSTILSFPIAVGKKATSTPTGKYRVIDKTAAPAWHVPESIRRQDPHLPKVVPPGPRNPLGRYALRLTDEGLMIHGTNAPASIGGAASHGCIRMYPEDIKKLFQAVPRGTEVEIRREPLRVAPVDGVVYLQWFGTDREVSGQLPRALRLVREAGFWEEGMEAAVEDAMLSSKGQPVPLNSHTP